MFLSPPRPLISMLSRYLHLECKTRCKIKACLCFFDLGAHLFNIDIWGARGAAEKTRFCPTGFFFAITGMGPMGPRAPWAPGAPWAPLGPPWGPWAPGPMVPFWDPILL